MATQIESTTAHEAGCPCGDCSHPMVGGYVGFRSEPEHACNIAEGRANHQRCYLALCACGWTTEPLLRLEAAEAAALAHETPCAHCGEPSTHEADDGQMICDDHSGEPDDDSQGHGPSADEQRVRHEAEYFEDRRAS